MSARRVLLTTVCVVQLVFGAVFVGMFSGCREPAETAVPKLIKQLKSQDSHERNVAARALAGYGPDAKKAVRPLSQALWDDNMGVRTSAAYALRKIGTPKALRVLEHYKKEKERQNKEFGPQR